MRVAILALFFLVLSPFALAQDAGVHHVVYLTDGTVLPGEVVWETEDAIILEHATLGRLEIRRASIERIEGLGVADPRPDWKTDPSENSILFAPTPATLPKGTAYFRSIELFLLNFGYAPTNFLNLSVGTLFPITDDFILFMAGAKLQVLDRNEFPIGLALTGGFTYLDELQDDTLWSTSAVVGIGDARRSFNVALGGAFSGSDSQGLVLVGGDFQIGSRTKLIAEFGNTSALLFDEDDFDGLMNIGFRFFGDSMSFTLTGFRPLGDTSSLVLFPLGVFSINW